MSRRVTVPKLSAKETLILELLVERSEMYGLELVAASGKQLKRGTVYVTLGRMEDKGYITSHVEAAPSAAGGLPRRMYVATPLGRRLLTAWSKLARQFVAEFAR
jgi:PadR family transcriptional regulator PadR